MNVQSADTRGSKAAAIKRKGRQPVDNSFPALKIALREWVVAEFMSARVLDVYGGYGLMYRQVWSRVSSSYEATDGDSLAWLQDRESLDYDLFDVDPYGSPFEALQIIAKRAIRNRIGLVCTDGCLRRQGTYRGNLPKVVEQTCGWGSENKALMASIYYNYPGHLRYLLRHLMPGWFIETLAVRYGKGGGKHTMAYFAFILKRVES